MAVTSPFTTHRTVPYLTAEELRAAPMSRNIQHFFPNPDDTAATTTQIAAMILRASGLVNRICGDMPLHAHANIEAGWVPVIKGMAAIHPRHWPITSVVSIELGAGPNTLTASDLSAAEIEPFRVRVPAPMPQGQIYARWTTTSGWPITTLTAETTVGATSMTVADSAGINPGVPLTIIDGRRVETVVPTAVAGNVLTVPALAQTHIKGAGVSGLPEDVKQATILLIDAGLEFADTYALTITKDDRGGLDDGDRRKAMLEAACDMLKPFRRVR